jgi:hypothetical protein
VESPQAGQLSRTAPGEGWTSGATSKRAVTKVTDEVVGVSADCDQIDKQSMIGLNSGSTNTVDNVLDFGIVCDNGKIRISEHGDIRTGDFGSYFEGETFQVSVLSNGTVGYFKDGDLFAVGSESPAFPLYATVRFGSNGASLSRVHWVKRIVKGANDLQYVTWTDLKGTSTDEMTNGGIQRSARGNSWRTGARTQRAITKVGDEVRGLSFDAGQTNMHLFVGLTAKNVDYSSENSHRAIDYAIYLHGNGYALVKENDAEKKNLGPYTTGETFQVALSDEGKIQYFVDGELKYTSDKAPSFPLYGGVAIHTGGAKIDNVRWISEVPVPE